MIQISLQLLLTTVQIGAVIVLFALGLTLIFGVLRIVNFAHGQFFTLSALIVAVTVPALAARGWPIAAAYLAGVVSGVVVGSAASMVLYQFGLRRVERDMTGSFIMSTGAVLLLEGAFQETFGGSVRPVPPLFEGNVSFWGMSIASQRLALCAAAVAATLVFYWLLARSKFGKALRATAIDHEAAMLQGIPYRSIALRGYLLATVVGTFAGALTAPIAAVTPNLGDSYLVKGFIAVVVGGLGSVGGAILGSALIAFVESVGGYFFDPSMASLAIFVLVMAILLVRPTGILSRG